MCLITKVALGSKLILDGCGDMLGFDSESTVVPQQIFLQFQGKTTLQYCAWERRRRASLFVWMCMEAVEIATHFISPLELVCIAL